MSRPNRSPVSLAQRRSRATARHRERKYGMPSEQFDALLRAQRGACAVCRLPFTSTAHVDHDHETGRVRGLLCLGCNHTEGFIRKIGLTPRQFSALLKDYLQSPPAENL